MPAIALNLPWAQRKRPASWNSPSQWAKASARLTSCPCGNNWRSPPLCKGTGPTIRSHTHTTTHLITPHPGGGLWSSLIAIKCCCVLTDRMSCDWCAVCVGLWLAGERNRNLQSTARGVAVETRARLLPVPT